MDAEAVENELNCSICLDTYTDPKILQCFHVYCQKCLVKLVIRNQQGQLILSCPICRQVTPVPANGTAGLQSAFHINRLLDVLLQHKKSHGNHGTEVESGSVGAEGAIHPANPALCCPEHGGREMELFCESCEELLCLKCVIKGAKHYAHDYLDITESFQRYKEQVLPFLKPLKRQMTNFSKLLTQLDEQGDEISEQQAIIEARIEDSCKKLHEAISKREHELMNRLDRITKSKLKGLAMHKDKIEMLQAQVSGCLEFTEGTLEMKEIEQCDVLVMKTSIIKQARELSAPPQQVNFTPFVKADVTFSGAEDAVKVCDNFGRVFVQDSPDPSKCVAIGKGTEEAVVGEKATVHLASFTAESKPCSDDLVSNSIEVKIVSEIGNKVLQHGIEQAGKGKSVISYQPVIKGRHQLHIKANDQHITGSPFTSIAKLPVEKLGPQLLTFSGLRGPSGVAINGKGEVVVTERGAHRVSIFCPSGKKCQSFGQQGSEEGLLDEPFGVAVDGNENLIVVDMINHRIQKFTTDGAFLKAAGHQGSGTLQFNRPCGIAYCPSNDKLYVSDTLNHRIQVLNSDLTFFRVFGKEGDGKGQFQAPSGIATDSTGRVYVADSGNHRIQVISPDGRLWTFGKRGSRKGELSLPFGVSVDASGLVYVSEGSNHRVSVFTSEGRFVTAFGREGKGSGQFKYPQALAVDDVGTVYVCDNSRVQLF